MKVRELLDTAASEVWITTSETPIHSTPEIRVKSMTDRDEKDFLSKEILDSEIHLIGAPYEGVIYASLDWDRKKKG